MPNNSPWWAQRQVQGTMSNSQIMQPSLGNAQNYSANAQNMMRGQTQNLTTQQEQQAFSVFPGKFIASEQDISVKDVPMEAPMSLFPSSDFSYIIAKAWNAQGTIDTVVYVPQVQKQPETKEDPFVKLNERLDRIEKSLKQRKPYNSNHKPYYNKNHQNGGKKEEDPE